MRWSNENKVDRGWKKFEHEIGKKKKVGGRHWERYDGMWNK